MSTGTINEARLRACVGAFLEIGRACGDDTSELFGAVIARPAELPVIAALATQSPGAVVVTDAETPHGLAYRREDFERFIDALGSEKWSAAVREPLPSGFFWAFFLRPVVSDSYSALAAFPLALVAPLPSKAVSP